MIYDVNCFLKKEADECIDSLKQIRSRIEEVASLLSQSENKQTIQTMQVFAVIAAAAAIRVPVDSTEAHNEESAQNKPSYYTRDRGEIDSYLLPPNTHAQDEPENAPATYLLPPAPEKQSEFLVATEEKDQSDWYPIAQTATKEKSSVPKQLETDRIVFQIPSRQLEPPRENSGEFTITVSSEEQQLPAVELKRKFKMPPPSTELELPSLKLNENFNPLTKNVPVNFHLIPVEPTLALHLTPPQPLASKYKNPTNLYPKKYTGFKPVPIPIAQFADDTSHEVPKARPLKSFKPILGTENEYYIPYDEKKVYQFEKAEQKRKLQDEDETSKEQQQPELDDVKETDGNGNSEQEASETNFRHPGRNAYPAPLRQPTPRAPKPTSAHEAQAPKERTEFRMHGMNGPHSYQFGYDTGKGKNRQFRFEERDNDGRVKGHYGYMDRSGKLRVVNYNADPDTGFHAEPSREEQ